jgi:hypothetical protein
MKRRSLPLAACAAVLGAAVLAQPQARAVSSGSPGAAPAAHSREAAKVAQNPDSAEFTLNPGWVSAAGLAVDRRGDLVVVGSVSSDRFPVTGGNANTSCQAGNGALQVLSRDGTVLYSTCLGGERAVAFDALTPSVAALDDGSVWATAYTYLRNEPREWTVWRLAPDRASLDEVFVSRLLSGCLIAAAPSAAVWLACEGYAGLATVNAWQPTYGGNRDVFVMRFEPGRREPALLSYLGGPGIDWPWALAVARDGDLVVVGSTYGPGFPYVRPFQPTPGGAHNLFVARVDVSGRWLEFSSPFEVAEYAPSARVVVDGSGNTFVLAMPAESFPPPAALPVTRNRLQDVYLLELDPAGGLRQLTMVEPGFQTRVAPYESLYLHHVAARADGSLLVVRTFSLSAGTRSGSYGSYGGGAIASFLDHFGRAIREVEYVELQSGRAWAPWAVASGPGDLYVAGVRERRPDDWVVKRVGIPRAERDRTPLEGSTGKR